MVVGRLAVRRRERRQRILPVQAEAELGVRKIETDVVDDVEDLGLQNPDLFGEGWGRIDEKVNIDLRDGRDRGCDRRAGNLCCTQRVIEHCGVEPIVGGVVVAGDPVGRAGAVVRVVGDTVAIGVGQRAHAVDNQRVRVARETNASRVTSVQLAANRKVLAHRTVRAPGGTLRRRVDDRVLAIERTGIHAAGRNGGERRTKHRKSSVL